MNERNNEYRARHFGASLLKIHELLGTSICGVSMLCTPCGGWGSSRLTAVRVRVRVRAWSEIRSGSMIYSVTVLCILMM